MKKILIRKTLLAVIIIMLVIVYIACNVISICRYANVYEDKKCDVAVVLGAAANDNGVSEVYKQRLNHAAQLYQNADVSKIIVTGGMGEGNSFTDAYMARKYLESVGIPDNAIFEEDTSTITQENLENAKKIMDENGYQTALIVSDPLHMKRAMLLAKDAEIEAFSSPTQSSAYKSIKTKVAFVARETFFYIGYKWYRLFR
ncbi:MAG: YdcF family protein [Lachnospiraceae bacterium]|nr:YdcF family protein [Lachnospiraceae bacterium]